MMLCLSSSIAFAGAPSILSKLDKIDHNQLKVMTANTAKTIENKKTAPRNQIDAAELYDVALSPKQISDLEWQINHNLLNQTALASAQGKGVQVASMETQSPPIIGVQPGGLYFDSLDSNTLEKWYVFSITSTTKITSLMQQIPASQNYNLSLFGMPTGETAFRYFGESSLPGSANEQLSAITTPGTYIMVVQAIGSATSDQYLIGSIVSDSYDQNEPNDSIWQAKQVPWDQDQTGTLDNLIDADFTRITLTEPTEVTYKITGGDYQAQLMYVDGNHAFTLENNKEISLTLPAQSFYWRVYSPSGNVDPALTYAFTAKKAVPRVDKLVFNNKSDSHDVNNKFDWGHGSLFGLKHETLATGYAYDANGDPIEGVKLNFLLKGSVNSNSFSLHTVTTDNRGWYYINLESPLGASRYFYQESHLCSYFDLHELVISDARDGLETPLARVETTDDGRKTIEDGRLTVYDITNQVSQRCPML